MTSPLTVICCYFNPGNYKSHTTRYERFKAHMQESGVRLVTVECVFPTGHVLPTGETVWQEYQVTNPGHPNHVQVNSRTPLWLKENLLNLGVMRCHTPYVMWSDMDLEFEKNWVADTIAMLQYPGCLAAIPYSLLLLEQPNGQPEFQQYHTMANRKGVSSLPNVPLIGECNGGAWAFHRDALLMAGGLFDQHILGDGDDVLAFSMQRRPHAAIRPGMHPHTIQSIHQWASHVQDWKIGAVPSVARHHWHGSMKARGYTDRWKILIEEHFDPTTDLVRNVHDVWECTKPALTTRISAYFHARQEDIV